MAVFGWRERGYVPDSDEEDDISTELPACSGNSQSSKPENKHELDRRATDREADEYSALLRDEIFTTDKKPESAAKDSDPKPVGPSHSLQNADAVDETNHRTTFTPKQIAKDAQVEEHAVSDGSPLSSVADDLQSSLELGLQTVEGILHPSQDEPHLPTTSKDESGHAQMSMAAGQERSDDNLGHASSLRLNEAYDDNDLPVRGLRAFLASPSPTSFQRPVRNLRQRNPVQVHPYSLDSSRTRQIFQAAGLKLPRIASPERERSSSPSASLDRASLSPQTSKSRRNFDAKHQDKPSSHRKRRNHCADSLLTSIDVAKRVGNYDVTDFDILRRRLPSQDYSNKKRRRQSEELQANGTTSHPHVDDSNVFDFSFGENPIAEPDTFHGALNAPTSPPHSGSNAPRNTSETGSPVFRFPRGITPPRFPTPVTSSDTRHGPVDRDQQGSSVVRSASPEEEESRSTDSPCDQDRERKEENLRKLARKMHGVLPAAYLRLNDKAQNSRMHPSAPSTQRTRRTVGATGRKIPLLENEDSITQEDYDTAFSISDNPSSDTEGRSRGDFVGDRTPAMDFNEGIFHTGTFDEAAVEDNREIDFMLPKEQRQVRTVSRPRKRQKRLDGVWGTGATGVKGSRSLSKHHTLISKSERRRVTDETRHVPRKHKSVLIDRQMPVMLGVLDSPDVFQRQKQDQPLFLRIAARKARHLNEKGRKAPSYNQIQLPTAQDNEDINTVLRDWHCGKLAQATSVSRSSISNARQALSELSNHQQQIEPTLLHQDSRGEFVIPGAPEFSNLDGAQEPSDLNNNARIGADSDLSTPAQQKPSKKSGKGRLLTTFGAIQHPRAAQIEQCNVPSRSRRSLVSALSALKSNPVRAQTGRVSRSTQVQSCQGNGSIKNTKTPIKSTTNSSAQSSNKLPRPHQARKRVPRPNFSRASRTGDGHVEIDQPRRPLIRSVLVESNDLMSFETLNPNRLGAGTAFDMTTMIGSEQFSHLVHQEFLEKDQASASRAGCAIAAKFQSTSELPRSEKLNGETFSRLASMLTSFSCNWSGLPFNRATNDTQVLKGTDTADMKDQVMSAVNYMAYQVESEPLDTQIQCIQEVLTHTSDILKKLEEISEVCEGSACRQTSWLGILSRLMLLTFKAWHFAHTLDSNSELFHLADHRMKHLALITLSLVLHPHNIQVLRKRSQELTSTTGHRIVSGDVEIESLVIANNILCLCREMSGVGSIWDHIKEALIDTNRRSDRHAAADETIWAALFAILPILEIDVYGNRSEQVQHSEDISLWELVQYLLRSPLQCRTPSATAVLYFRCYHLATTWGWTITPNALNLMIEMLLEEVHSQRSYVPAGGLDDIQDFCRSPPQQGESSTSVVLKLVAKSIYARYEGECISNRNVSSLIAKITPTQSHDVPRISAKQYLAFVRQQYDVLSVIYVSAPEPSKPSLRQFKRLVNIQEASMEVCQIGIDLCRRMTRYDIKFDHETEGFIKWMDELLLQIYGHWMRGQAMDLLSGFNSPSYESLLTYGLSSMQDLIPDCSHGSRVIRVIPQGILSQILHSAINKTALQNVVPCAITLVQEMVAWQKSECQPLSKEAEDDSQDYGTVEWAAFDDGVDDGHASVVHYILDHFYLLIKRLLSSALRSESSISKAIFEKAVSCWAKIAHSLVREGLREWNAYFDPHADDSWSLFEDCARTTDGMNLFLTEVMKLNPHFYFSHQQTVLKSYLKGMIDMEADAVNLASLHHLIVETNHSTDVVCQSIRLGQTRLESITTIIINMQQTWHASGGVDLKNGQCRLVGELGHYLIQEMIKSWRSQNHGNKEMAQRKIDLYSGIVHVFLIYLPEYAPQLEFFTKGDQFPYKDTAIFVKVHGYAQRIPDGKNIGKAFITYVHSLLENVAANAGYEDLVNQLLLAMGLKVIIDDLSDHRIQHAAKVRNGETVPLNSAPLPTAVKTREAHQLRLFLLGNVFPSYISNAFTPTGRFLVMPIVEFIIKVYETLRLHNSQWEDAPRLYQLTRELLDVCLNTLASSPLRDTVVNTEISAAEKRDYERIDECLQQVIDLTEMTVDYMERFYDEGEEEGGDRVDLRAGLDSVMQEGERELARYTERIIEEWKKQVVCRQGAYYVRGKCIGEA